MAKTAHPPIIVKPARCNRLDGGCAPSGSANLSEALRVDGASRRRARRLRSELPNCRVPVGTARRLRLLNDAFSTVAGRRYRPAPADATLRRRSLSTSGTLTGRAVLSHLTLLLYPTSCHRADQRLNRVNNAVGIAERAVGPRRFKLGDLQPDHLLFGDDGACHV